jgi:hypothetical protein
MYDSLQRFGAPRPFDWDHPPNYIMDVFSPAIEGAKSAAEQHTGHNVSCRWFSVPEYFNCTMRRSVLAAAIAAGCDVEDEDRTLKNDAALVTAYGFDRLCPRMGADCDVYENHYGIWIEYDMFSVRMRHIGVGRISGSPKICYQLENEQNGDITPGQLRQKLRQLNANVEATFEGWRSIGTVLSPRSKFVVFSDENDLDRFELLKNAVRSVFGDLEIGWHGQSIDPRYVFSVSVARKHSLIEERAKQLAL